MIAPEYFNNHIAVEGEIIVKTVSNDTGFVVVWNPTTKKISRRTNSEIIADLNLVTTSNENFFSNSKILSSAIGNVATTLDAELPNGGFISSYNTSGWGGADKPIGASYGGYIKFKGYSSDINNLDLYYNNGHDGTEPRLWFRTKEAINGVREWSEFLHTKNIGSANLITNDQNPVNLFDKENKFGWINGAVSGAGGINEWVGNYLSIGGSNLAHKSQLLVSKTQLLFRGNHGNEDTSFNEVYHTGNFSPNNYSPINHSHQSLYSSDSGVVDANSLFEDYKLKLNQRIDSSSTNMFPVVDNANSIVSIASHPGGYGVQLGFNDNEGAFFRSVAGGNFGNWKQFAYRDWVTAQINNQSLNFVPYTGATQDVNLGANDLEFNGGGAISKHQNSVRIFNKVYQGYYDVGGHTGILAIKMPQASPDQAMFSIDINIYGYESQYLGKVNVAFYKYVSGAMISNGSKAIWEVTDNFPTTTARVGIGADGYVSILLGESDTFWNGYFSFEVAKVEIKYGNYNLDWNVGWSHALESNFDLYTTNIITLPSDVVATRSWLTNFVDNNYVPRAVQYNNNFNGLGGYSTSGIYRANNDAGGVNHLYSPMLHMGAQDTTAQLQVKYNDGSVNKGELSYRGGFNGSWTPWRTAWDNINFKPTDYQTKNTDEIISAAKSYYNRIPFKLKNSSYKSWSIQKPTNNNLILAPSVTKNAEDWDLSNGIEFTDGGQVLSKGFNKIGYNDNYILTAGGGQRLASDFVSSSELGNYLRKDGGTLTGALNMTSPYIGTWRGTAIGGNYMTWQKYDGSKAIAYIGADGGAAYGGGTGDNFAVRATGASGDLLLVSDSGAVKIQGAIPWTANNFNPDSKVNNSDNVVGLAFDSGSASGTPYFIHTDGTYVPIATHSLLAGNYALNDGSNAKDTWLNSSLGLGANPGYFGRSFDSNGAASLLDATYGNMMGYINTSGNGAPDSEWYHRLKMLHQNSAGYNGEIAVQMTGGNSLQYRKMEGGKESGWIKVWDNSNFSPESKVNAWQGAQSLGFSGGNTDDAPYIYTTGGQYKYLATQSWVSSNFANQTLSILPEGEDGQWINLSNSAGVLATNHFITSRDGTRDPNTVVKPNGNGRRVRFDFVNAGHVGGTGNYAGLMTYAPWDGTSASTGDSSYQLAFANQTGINGEGAPMLKIRKGIDDKWSDQWYKLWNEADFSQSHINKWNYMSQYGLQLNQTFTVNTNSGLAITDNVTDSQSGMVDLNEKNFVSGKRDKYYKYGSGIYDFEGLNYSYDRKLFGMGSEANDVDKLTVEGSVKATGNFKSADEKPTTLFIPDGSLSYLEDEITNEDSRMRLSHRMIEQQQGVQVYYSDNRMLVIRCTYGEHFILEKCFPGQRILVLNANDSYVQGFEIKSSGSSYKIQPYSAIQLFVWEDMKVYKYAENRMY